MPRKGKKSEIRKRKKDRTKELLLLLLQAETEECVLKNLSSLVAKIYVVPTQPAASQPASQQVGSKHISSSSDTEFLKHKMGLDLHSSYDS